MAKKTTTTHRFYVVDLVRTQPRRQFIEIPKTRVDVTIEVTTTALLRNPKVAITYDKLCNDRVNKCSFEIDRLDKDTGDNRKSLKHCKSAFAAIGAA